MTQLTLLVLIDAFRRDYLERTTFIDKLAATSAVGALREDFGFVPRAAYFGGLSPNESGFTNMFCCDPAASPFGVARGLPASGLGRAAEDELGLRGWIEAEARRRVLPYAASYLSTVDIPIDVLPNFDLVEKRAPWDPAVGYRSVFHELTARGESFVSVAWPETNLLSDHSDRQIVAAALTRIQPPCRLAYVHLQQLDAIGHAHGPESAALATALAETDALVESLVTELQARFDRVDIVLFGDHGMVSVTRTADVWAALDAAGLRGGRDLTYFLDSTMARFWFPLTDLGADVRRALAGLPGRVLEADDLARYGINRCDPRNGELFFLADPGVLVLPNFFQRRGAPLRGMHGYDPDCPDNQGLFLVHEPAQDSAADLGVVASTAVHSTIRRLLGLSRDHVPAARVAPAHDEGIFTCHPDPAADVMVATHMSRALEEIRQIAPAVEMVLLTGSFGRGEGGVRRGETGQFVPVNDYDVLVIAANAPDAQSPTLKALDVRLAEEFGTDFVHFTFWPTLSPALPATLSNYDLRYGSRVLLGQPDALAALPPIAAADIPLFEGVQLLFNRLGGLLTGLGRDGARGPRAERYLVNQTMKALMALGDWQLLRARAYDASYRTREIRFTWLSPGLQLPDGQAEAIAMAYQFKLYPESVALGDITMLARATADWLVQATVLAISEMTGRPMTTPSDAAAAYYEATTADAAAVAHDNAFSSRTLDGDAIVQVHQRPDASVRQTIYASIPLIASAWIGDREGFTVATQRLSACLTPPWPSDLTPANWEVVRQRLAHAWLSLVH
jgi:hypothetical protein